MYYNSGEATIYPDTLTQLSAVNSRRTIARTATAKKWLKRGIWLYLWLLIFEGALRKWVLPGLSDPLLIIRDPVALWLLVYAYINGFTKSSFYTTAMWVCVTIATVTTLTMGHGNLLVAVYGARLYILHFPLIFLIGHVFDYEDVVHMGKAILWVAIPMTVLMAFQFYSPQSAWVNRGLGGDIKGAGFFGFGKFFRPPGTFSFVNGLASFYGLVAGYVFFFWMDSNKLMNRWVLIVASACLLAAIPFSVSRTLLFSVGLSAVFTVFISFVRFKNLPKTIGFVIGGAVLYFAALQLGFFKTGVDVMTSRVNEANGFEGGSVGSSIGNRFFSGLALALSQATDYPFWGLGLGMGSNAGAKLLTGKVGFIISEGEWSRILGEMGILLGLIVIFIRIHFVWRLGTISYRKLKTDNFLPWMLFSFALPQIIQAQWSQPTALGFSVLVGGLMTAAFKPASIKTQTSINKR